MMTAQQGHFTHLMVSGETSVLRCLHGMLEHEKIESRAEFNDLMCAAFKHGRLNYKAMSDDLGYSPSSVHRWIDGRSAPHPGLWPRITRWVSEALDEEIRRRERDEANSAQVD